MKNTILLPSFVMLGLAGCTGMIDEGAECFDTGDGVVCTDPGDSDLSIAGRHKHKRLHDYDDDACFESASSSSDVGDIGALNIAADDPSLAWGPCPPFFPAGCEIAVIQGDPSQPNSDVFFRLPANTDFPYHTHTSPERMAVVQGTIEVTYTGQDTQVLETGDYAYGPAQAPHGGRCLDNGPCVLVIALEDPLDAFPVDGVGTPAAEQAVSFSPDGADVQWGPCPPLFAAGCEVAAVHGDPSQPNADLFFRVPPDYEFAGHTHTSPERMVVLTGTVEADYPPQATAVLETLNYAYGPAGAPHRAYCRDGDGCTLFIAFEDAVDAFALTCESDDSSDSDSHGHGGHGGHGGGHNYGH